MTTISERIEILADYAAMDYLDAMGVPVDHPDDEQMRIDFAGHLNRLIDVAIAETQDDFRERAEAMAQETT